MPDPSQDEIDAAVEATVGKTESPIKTYLQTAFDVIEMQKAEGVLTPEREEGILSFAKYLDGGNKLTYELALLAYKHSAAIDREIILGLAQHIPKATVEKIVRDITRKHKHQKRMTVDSGTSTGN